MKSIGKLFPFIPSKGDTTRLIVALVFYILGALVAIPVATVVLSLTIILAVLVAVVVPLIIVYSWAGVLFTILSFVGVMDLNK